MGAKGAYSKKKSIQNLKKKTSKSKRIRIISNAATLTLKEHTAKGSRFKISKMKKYLKIKENKNHIRCCYFNAKGAYSKRNSIQNIKNKKNLKIKENKITSNAATLTLKKHTA